MKAISFFQACVLAAFSCGIGLAQAPSNNDLSLEALLSLRISLASRTEQTLAEAPSVVSVITAQDIQQMGARSLEDVLRTVPGFDVVLNPQGSNLGFGVRGTLGLNFSSNSIKYLLNGHTLNSLTGSPLHYFDYFPIENIQKIEIIRGPGSALYGANAFFGVINIITKTKEKLEDSHVDLAGGSFSTYRPFAFFNQSQGEFNWSIAANYSETDGPKRPVESDFGLIAFGASSVPNLTTYDAKYAGVNIEAEYRNFSASLFYNELERNWLIGLSGASTDENLLDITYGFLELAYEKNFSDDRHKLFVKTYYDHYDFLEFLEIFSEETAAQVFNLGISPTPFPADEGIHGQPGNEFALWGTEVTLDFTLKEGIRLLTGVLHDRSKIYDPVHSANTNITGAPIVIDGVTYTPLAYLGGFIDIADIPGGNWITTEERVNTALYAQATIDFKELGALDLESLVLTLGVRHDDYDDIGSTTNPRMGLVYAPKASLFFKVLYGEAFRAPTFDELYQINNSTTVGNPNLAPEKIETFEFQIGHIFADKIYSTVSYFDIDLSDNIQLIRSLYANIGRIKSKGFELESKMIFNQNYSAYINATFNDVVNAEQILRNANGDILATQENFENGNSPDYLINLGFNGQLTDMFHLNLTVNHASERKRSAALQYIETLDLVAPFDARGEPTPERTLVNVTLSFNVTDKLDLQVSGFNILDEDHRDPDNTATILNDVPREEASFSGRIRYRF